jgi:outer membrane protein
MKQLFSLVLILGFTQFGYAQSKIFSLEECIAYALENSVAAKNAAIDQEIAKAKVKETVGIGLPQVSGSVSVDHNEKLRRFFAVKQTAFGFSGLPDDQYPNFYPELSDNDVIASQNFFQLKNSGDAGITINQIIFNGSYLVGLQASNAFKNLATKEANQTNEQITQQVTKAYYAVLINKERANLFESNIARVDTLLRNTKALNANGFSESIDVDRIQVTLNNLIAERDKFLNLNTLGVELLKFQMNYPMNEPLEVSGTINDIQVDTNSEAYADWDYKSRPDYQVLEANKRLQELNIKNKYAESLPSLSARANLGYSTQSRTLGGIFTTDSDISDNGTIGPDKWYGYSLIGVSLNIPLFTGLQRNYQIQQEKFKLQKINNGFTSLKSSIDLEIKQASINYDNALKSLTAQKQNMELADKIARITKIKYEQGVGSNLEVVTAEDGLRQAQTNYYSSLFDVMIAKVDLDKAYGKLIIAKK